MLRMQVIRHYITYNISWWRRSTSGLVPPYSRLSSWARRFCRWEGHASMSGQSSWDRGRACRRGCHRSTSSWGRWARGLGSCWRQSPLCTSCWTPSRSAPLSTWMWLYRVQPHPPPGCPCSRCLSQSARPYRQHARTGSSSCRRPAAGRTETSLLNRLCCLSVCLPPLSARKCHTASLSPTLGPNLLDTSTRWLFPLCRGMGSPTRFECAR